MNEHEKTDMFKQAYGYSMGVSWFIISAFLKWEWIKLGFENSDFNFWDLSCLVSTEEKKGGVEWVMTTISGWVMRGFVMPYFDGWEPELHKWHLWWYIYILYISNESS